MLLKEGNFAQIPMILFNSIIVFSDKSLVIVQ